jgi:hypothetical protein
LGVQSTRLLAYDQGKERTQMSTLNITIFACLGAASIYIVLFLLSSIFGMHEQDTIDLSGAGTQKQEDQRQMMKTITTLGTVTRWVGFLTLGLAAVLAAIWLYSVVQNLMGH